MVLALASAVLIPADRPGLGWAIAGVALLALVRKGFGVLWPALAFGLLFMSVFRSAGWVFALCVAAVLILTAVAVVDGRTWRELGLALPRWVWGAMRVVPSVTAASDRHGAVRLARGIGAGLALVVLFGLLLGSAEREFADLLRPLLSWTRLATFGCVALLCLGALHLRGVHPSSREVNRKEWSRLEWAIPVALVDLLFATFAVVQFTVLFGGHEHVLDPHGPTYAQYARGGFLELATVALLTLAVVAAVLSRVAPADRALARVLVGLLCGLTLVIVGSALRRMQLYVEAFGFTRTRLLATAVIVWLGLIFLLVLLAWGRAILPRLTLATGAAVLLGLVILNPDRLVAQTVIGRWEKDGHLDAPYLASLSPDALPALKALPDPKRSCIAGVIVRNHLRDRDAWNEWNHARAGGRKVVLKGEDCAFYMTSGYRMEGNWTDPSEVTSR